MEVITVFLIVSALAGLVIQYVIRAVPFYLISEILAGGAVASVINEFNGGALDQNGALVLVIVMLAVCIFSAWNFVNYYWPARK